MPPTNPNWPAGYVPSALEWNQAFAVKADYPVPVDQGGTGAITMAGAAYGVTARALISSTPAPLQAMFWYGVKTSVGAITLLLPALSSLQPGDWIWIVDIDYAANTNNITINAFGSDSILAWGTPAGAQTLDVAGARVMLMVNSSSWTMTVG